ncbi:MAG TPA: glycoside hydrolase family 6 protein [Micromonosporaceae bacterium]|nr:glycoside hydrolase family 6 protein [Micromonosporaceae bacterium]
MHVRPRPEAGRSALRRAVSAAVAVLLGSTTLVVSAHQAQAATGCSISYRAHSWDDGFTGTVAITNHGDRVGDGWLLEWDYAGNQTVKHSWNSTFTQAGRHVTLRNVAWNASLPTNGTVSAGFNAAYSGTNTAPTTFRLNGVTCNDDLPPADHPTNGPPSTPPAPDGSHLDNPYIGRGYVNPEWRANVLTLAGGSRIADNPTAVWLDRIAAIGSTSGSSSDGSMGLRDHLDTALAQGADYIQLVIYNLPGRECAARGVSGELAPTELVRYQKEYIDAIAKIEEDPRYANLRIIHITEPGSLVRLITNTRSSPFATARCDAMLAYGNYVKGIQYALGTFRQPNVYQYLDAGHHGSIGWPLHFDQTAELLAVTARGAVGGVATVDGFIVNTANYSALREPFLNANTTLVGTSVKVSKWVDWNDYVDELTFAQGLRTRLLTAGFEPDIGMLIDTSRNGWGGPNRPTAPSTSFHVDTFVDESRVDRRISIGNWCNQSGAGLGERPTANPEPGIDAYVWAKPPGESDGSSVMLPGEDGQGFDEMCGQHHVWHVGGSNQLPTGALPNAPVYGAFFPAHLLQLMANAYPTL